MKCSTAKILWRDDFACCSLHQWRTAEEDCALFANDHCFVAHCGHVCATRGAGSHHGRDLGNAHGRHLRLVIEDAAEVFAVGKHFRLVRQVSAARIDELFNP